MKTMSDAGWKDMHVSDPNVRVRLTELPLIIREWLTPHLRLEGARILDFGCGEGITALGMALRHRPSLVLGCDISDEVAHCAEIASRHLGLQELPSNLKLYQTLPASLPAEADGMDLVYAWSVFEHVSQDILTQTLSQLHACLRRDGYLFIQIAPLFHSAYGSHMQEKVPEPWAHLSMQHNLFMDRLAKTCSDMSEYRQLASTYSTLNRITIPALVAEICSAGFEVVREYTTRLDIQPTPDLLAVYREEVLTTNQVALLARRR